MHVHCTAAETQGLVARSTGFHQMRLAHNQSSGSQKQDHIRLVICTIKFGRVYITNTREGTDLVAEEDKTT